MTAAKNVPSPPVPDIHLLGNGRLGTMVSSAGGGSSRRGDVAVNRWRDDATRDACGMFCYVRDDASGRCWSTTFQPTVRRADAYEVAFDPGRATVRRRDGDVTIETVLVVAPGDDVELRRIRIRSDAPSASAQTLTSYAEVVLGSAAGDADHPAFQKLFVETEIDASTQTLLCTRRPQTPEESRVWMFHALVAADGEADPPSFETDRARFIGRGRSTRDPAALDHGEPLSGTTGAVLDPVVAVRRTVHLQPGVARTVALVTGVADSREACLALALKYRDLPAVDDAIEAATARASATLAAARLTAADARVYDHLAASMLYANGALRADPAVLLRNRLGQPGLWAHAISGDLPIAFVSVSDIEHVDLATTLLKAHTYWLAHGVVTDLVIVDDGDARQADLHRRLAERVAEAGPGEDKKGQVFLLAGASLAPADRVLLQTVARIALVGADGRLAEWLDATTAPPVPTAAFVKSADAAAVLPAPAREDAAEACAQAPLQFDNGLGGFSADGREYVVTASRGAMTPMPWLNVLANPTFGTIVSESGSASTWSENAQLFRLTSWSNDPITDTGAEAIFIRDEDSGRYWSPTLLPCAGDAPVVARHGFGYSVFEHQHDGIASELTLHVAMDAPVKFSTLVLRNRSARPRRLSVTGYVDCVLGGQAEATRLHVSTRVDPQTGALLAVNPYNTDFAGRTAFFDTDPADTGASGDASERTFTGDRAAFLGANGAIDRPAAMAQPRLDGVVGAGLDPCAAIRVPLELAPGESRQVVFRLGAGLTGEEACALVARWRGSTAAAESLDAVKAHWQRTLGVLQVRTPDKALDLMANGWLVYQVLACRLWARTAFYQASGAFGFRDQLQDVMALVHAVPAQVRAHLLLAASRQFPEGDAQHWWHPPSGRGVRTRVSDDYLWLPLATCRYVRATGDASVLDESVHFLAGRLLKDGEASDYALATASAETGTLYEHCRRAILHGLRFGSHGLPLMGTGDWNDGMNAVGAQGKGESVWLAFFLSHVMTRFAEIALSRQDQAFADRCASEAARLRTAIQDSAWDGAWYRRAWFDDGSPLGTAANAECRIDSIAQSWAVLSGAGDDERSAAAMDALDDQLVSRQDKLIKLLAPPFDQSNPSPGYIQGYVQGVRENGGQYTHAAVWAAMAFAQLGDARRAWDLFDILNPIRHAATAADVATYMTEPYVVASDIYSTTGHVGRGGWTWYTGAAGWLYRCITESLLGLHIDGDKLTVRPCIPADWTSFDVTVRRNDAVYTIAVKRVSDQGTAGAITLDGVAVKGTHIALVDDGASHHVGVLIAAA
jgi:cellobiose phosphorylase